MTIGFAVRESNVRPIVYDDAEDLSPGYSMRSSNSVAGLVAAVTWTAGFGATAIAQNTPRTQTATFPAVTIPNTEVRSLHSAATGRDYESADGRQAKPGLSCRVGW